ncbi:MAG: protoporphyrinogen oxidase, partial [Nanoarchaeota archaeon]|nr:protoporphyrinogen oxidase [Nanoarchaeota archaeon]
FNPPYLPRNSKEPTDSQLSTTGGAEGGEIINEFLKEAKNYLEENGRIFLLTSSLTKNINYQNYHKKLLGKEKLFFEELFVWELRI